VQAGRGGTKCLPSPQIFEKKIKIEGKKEIYQILIIQTKLL
jgi:hypothetical protein